jgi:CRP-like cAMP-binding protein
MMGRDAREAVGRCYLFAEAEPRSLDALASACRPMRHPGGQSLFAAGDEADGLRIVLDGAVRIWISDAEGRELTLALMEEGDAFGEIALLDGLPRTASAVTLGETACLFLPARAFDDALSRDPGLARHLIRTLCELLRQNLDAVSALAFMGLGGRLAQKLHELALTYGDFDGTGARLGRRFSQTDLAHMLGVTREAVNKRFKALAHDGLVRQEAGRMVIPDMAALAARAQAEAGGGGR